MKKDDEFIGSLYLILSSIIGGFSGIFIRLMSMSFNIYDQIFLRFFSALIIFLFIFLVHYYLFASKHKIRTNKFDSKSLIKLGLTCTMVPMAVFSWTQAVVSSKIAIAIFSLYFATFISGALISRFAFKEKLTTNKILSLILAIFGVIIFSNSYSTLSLSNISWFGVLAGILWSIYSAFRKSLTKNISRRLIIIFPIITVTLVSFFFANNRNPILDTIQSVPISALLLIFIFGLLVVTTQLLSLKGISMVNLLMGNILSSFEIVTSTVFSYLIFHESLSMNEIIGGIFIFVAIISPSISGYPEKSKNLLLSIKNRKTKIVKEEEVIQLPFV